MSKDIAHLLPQVLAGTMTVGEAARAAGTNRMAVSRALQAHPDYAKAKAEGRIAARPCNPTIDPASLRDHPAIVDVVVNGMTYLEAATKHSMSVMTLNRWVKRAYPDYAEVRSRGRPPKSAKEPKPGLRAAAGFSDLLAAIEQFAAEQKVSARDVAVALLAES